MVQTSKERNRRKKRAMNALGDYLRDDPHDFEACLTDLMADLMHVTSEEIFDDCIRRARNLNEAERMGI